MSSNNDCGVRDFDMEKFQLCKHFRFPWPVNVSLVWFCYVILLNHTLPSSIYILLYICLMCHLLACCMFRYLVWIVCPSSCVDAQSTYVLLIYYRFCSTHPLVLMESFLPLLEMIPMEYWLMLILERFVVSKYFLCKEPNWK